MQILKCFKINMHIHTHTLKNSFFSTCSLPSISNILKAILNPVWGSATKCEKTLWCTHTHAFTLVHKYLI